MGLRFVLSIVAGLCLAACQTSYKIAPSTAKVTTKLATAKRSTEEAQKRAAALEANTVRAQTAAVTTEDHIDNAMAAILAKDYITAAQELGAAKASSELVKFMLEQSLREVKALGESLATTKEDLGMAEEGVKELNKTIEGLVLQGAKDRAIVDEVNWGFRIGALFYFVKGILKIGFFGIIILVVIVIVALCIGGPTAVYALRGLKALWQWTRKPNG